MIEILIAIVTGAAWRRWHGMGQGPRWVRLVVAFLLCWPLLLTGLPYWGMALIAGLVTWYWVPGHDWTNRSALIERYGPTPIALGYMWAHKVKKNDPQFLRSWGGIIDGPFALAEMNAGAWVYGVLAAAVVL